MNYRRLPAIIIPAFMLLACGACAATSPVDIDTKADTCARCRMSIDALSHAAEIVTADGLVRKYDSLGCFVKDHHELSEARTRLAGAWVIDYETKKWVKAENAYYARAKLPTDHMGFGVAATATRDAALKIVAGDGSKVVDFTGLLHGEG